MCHHLLPSNRVTTIGWHAMRDHAMCFRDKQQDQNVRNVAHQSLKASYLHYSNTYGH